MLVVLFHSDQDFVNLVKELRNLGFQSTLLSPDNDPPIHLILLSVADRPFGARLERLFLSNNGCSPLAVTVLIRVFLQIDGLRIVVGIRRCFGGDLRVRQKAELQRHSSSKVQQHVHQALSGTPSARGSKPSLRAATR